MTNDAVVDTLIHQRGKLEQELLDLRNLVAGRSKALEALNETISMLRGWGTEAIAPKMQRRSWDTQAVKDGVLDFFTERNGAYGIREICDYLEEKNVVPSFSDAVRASVSRIIREHATEIECVGKGYSSKYQLKSNTKVVENNGASAHTSR